MNIFYLNEDPKIAARDHADKHVVKMPLETAQLLCSAHRVLDGEKITFIANGRKKTRWALQDFRDDVLYNATHYNHPCAKWARASIENYNWLYNLFLELLKEYSYRYEKTHGCSKLIESLKNPPNSIPEIPMTEIPLAMPDYCKLDSPVASYKNYYLSEKQHLLFWKKRVAPLWVQIDNYGNRSKERV